MISPETRVQLTQSLELTGAAAWCVCSATRACEHHFYTNWFKPAQVEPIVTRLAAAMEGLNRRKIKPVQACWVFEHARVFIAQRTSGETLVLFVENRADTDFTPHQTALAEFAAGN